MKRPLLTALALALLLGACTASHGSTLTYAVTYKTDDAARQLQLGQSLEEVVKRRMAARNIEGAIPTVTPKGDAAILEIGNVKNEEKRKAIKELLAEPFSFDLRTTKVDPSVKEAEPSLDDWEKTGISGEDLTWVEVLQDPDSKAVGIELILTEGGRGKLDIIMQKHTNETLGIFVRDFLVSKLKIDGKEVKDHIVITGVPNPDIARIFADDVNVGILTSLSLQ